jgi:hypothetical protein
VGGITLSDNPKIDELEKRIEALNNELQKTNMMGNKNLPIIVKSFFVFLFLIIMGIIKPELVIKIFEMLIASFSVSTVVGV